MIVAGLLILLAVGGMGIAGLTAIAGAAILLLAYHLVTSRSTGRSRSRNRSGRSRSRRWAHR